MGTFARPKPATPRLRALFAAVLFLLGSYCERPAAAAISLRHGDILAANYLGHSLLRIDPSTGVQEPLGTFNFVQDVAIGPHRTEIYVARSSFGIQKLDLASGTISTVSSAGYFNGINIWGLVLGPDGFLYAATEGGLIVKVHPATGAQQLIGTIGLQAFGLDVSPTGNLYITTPSAVWQMDPVTGTKTSIATTPSGNRGVVSRPGGELFVGNNGILLSIPGGGVATNGTSIFGVAIESAGFLVASTYNFNGIVRIDAATGAVAPVSSGGLLNHPAGLVVYHDTFPKLRTRSSDGTKPIPAVPLQLGAAFGPASPPPVDPGSLTNGLARYLGFEDNLNDLSGNNQPGTGVGNLTYAPGQVGRAVRVTNSRLAGSFNYVSLGANSQLNYGQSTDFSVAFWAKSERTEGDPAFVANKNWVYGTNTGWTIGTQPDGRIELNYKRANAEGLTRKDLDFTDRGNVLNNPYAWAHVTIVWRINGNAETYLNGELVHTLPIGPGAGDIAEPGLSLNLGQDGTGAYSLGEWDGLLDEVAIWDRALTSSEVGRLFSFGHYGKSLFAPRIAAGLAVYLGFEDNLGDASGNNHPATAVGNINYVPGKVGKAVRMTNSVSLGSFNYVTLGNNTLNPFGQSGNFTVSFWVKSERVNGDPAIIANRDWVSGTTVGWTIGTQADGRIEYNYNRINAEGLSRKDLDFTSRGNLLNNTSIWSHIVVVWNIDGNAETYLNGELIHVLPIGPGIGDIFDPALALNLGQDGTGSYDLGEWDGLLDEVAIWNRSLSGREVGELFAYGSSGQNILAPATTNRPVIEPRIIVQSSNPAFVPAANVFFGGSGSNRTVNIGPASGPYGTARILLSVTDGWVTSTDSFLYNASPASVLWDRSYGGTNSDQVATLARAQDGGFALAGFSSSLVTQPSSGGDVTLPWDPIIASSLNSPFGEEVANAIDGSTAKYLNFDTRIGGTPSGFVVSPSRGLSVISAVTLQSANDAPERDPKTVTIEGSNDSYVSNFASGNWEPIATINNIPAFAVRFQTQVFPFANTKAFWHYRVTVTETQTANDCCFQIGEVELLGTNVTKTALNFGQTDYWIVRADHQGNKSWDRSFGGSLQDTLAYSTLQPASDGGWFVAGASFSSANGNKTVPAADLSYPGSAPDYWVLRLDRDGQKLWERVHGGAIHWYWSEGGTDWLNSLAPTSDGGCILIGASESYESTGNKTAVHRGGADFWVVRLDANGTKVWEQTYGGTWWDSGVVIQQTADGGFIAAGISYSAPGTGNKSSPNYGAGDFWVVRLDSNGTKLWDASFGGSGYEEVRSVAQLPDGGFILAGLSFSPPSSPPSGNKTSPLYGDSDGWVVRIDANGVVQWDKSYGGPYTDAFWTIQPANFGDFFLAGAVSTGPNAVDQEGWVVRIDSVGNLKWEKIMGGNANDVLRGLQFNGNGEIVVAGDSRSGASGTKASANYGVEDFWLTKLREFTPPTITPLANQTVPEDSATSPLPFTIGDAESISSNLVLTAVSSNPALVIPANIVFGGSGSNRTVVVAPVPNQSGSAVITVLVSDGFGVSSNSFVLAVDPVSDAPAITDVANQVFADDFASNTIDPAKYQADAPFFEGGVGTIHAEAGAEVMKFVGTTTTRWWSGGTLRLVPTFAPSESETITLSIDRVAEAGVGSASRSALWILNEAKDKYVLFADVRGEGGWGFNRKIGETGDVPSGLGTDIAAFNGGTFDDGLLHKMSMVADGKTVKLLLDGIQGTEVKFPFSPVIFQFGAYARNTNDTADTTWDNLKIESTGGTTFLAISEDTITGPLPFTVSDAETSAADLVVTAVSSNQALIPNTGILLGGSEATRTVTVVPLPNQNGSSTLTLTVSDGALTASDSFLVTVQPVNDAPTITALANQTINQGTSTAALPFTIGDVETPATSLSVVASSSNSTLVPALGIAIDGSGANRTVTVTPNANFNGGATITVTVEDGTLSNRAQFHLRVVAVPPPSGIGISDIPDAIRNEGVPLTNIPFTVGDVDTPASSLIVTATSSNQSLVPDSSIFFGGSESNRTLTVFTAPAEFGTATITVMVSDGASSASDSFVLTVNPVNNAPVISNVPDQTIAKNSATPALGITIVDSETPAANLALTAVSSNPTLVPNSNLRLAGSGANRSLVAVPADNQTGTSTITLLVTDEAGATANDTFLLTVIAGAAQTNATVVWDRTFGGIDADYGNSIDLTADGGFILGGHSWSGINGNKTASNFGLNEYWLVKTDADGNLVWDKTFGGSGAEWSEKGSLKTTSDGGFILAGYSYSPSLTGNKTSPYFSLPNGQSDAWVLRLDSAGTKIWETTLGGLNDDYHWGIQQTLDGGFILANSSNSLIGTNKSAPNFGGLDFWVVRLRSDGSILWDKSFGGSNNEVAYGILQTADGGFLVQGTSVSPPGSGNKTTPWYGNFDWWMVRLDAAGNKLWEATHGGTLADVPNSVRETADGGLILVGWSVSSDGTKTSANLGGSDGWVVRLSADGTKLWDRAYGGAFEDKIEDVSVLADGGFIFTGVSASGPAYIDSDVWVFRVDAAGTVVWEAKLGGTDYDYSGGVKSLGSGRHIISAQSASGPSSTKSAPLRGNLDYWLIALAEQSVPTISNIPDQSIAEDASTPAIPFTVGDAETPSANLTLAGTSSNQAIVPNANIVFGGSGSNRTLVVTPSPNQSGSAAITITASDGEASASETFLLAVNPMNDFPTIANIPDQTTNEDAPTAVIVFAVGDFDTVVTSLAVSGSSSNLGLVPNNSLVFGGSGPLRTLTITPALNQFGSTVVTINVNDGALSSSDTFTLTVNPANDAPTISDIPNQTTLEDTPTTAIVFAIDDIDTPLAGLSVTGTSSDTTLLPNANILISNSGASRNMALFPASNQYGTTTVTVTVRDTGQDGIPGNGDDTAAADTFVLTVQPITDPPTIIAQPASQDAAPGSNVTITVGLSGDPPFNYQWRFNGVDIAAAPNAASLPINAITYAHAGTYDVVISNSAGTITSTAATLGVVETVYENSSFPQGAHFQTTNELGDQLWLEGGARILRALQLRLYIGTVDGGESVVIRIYANDGLDGAPGAVLFQSSPIPITATGDVPLNLGTNDFGTSLVLPESVTVSAEFAGFGPNDWYGLQTFRFPATGVSQDRFWFRHPGGWIRAYWEPFNRAHFFARIIAVKTAQETATQPNIVIQPQSQTVERGGKIELEVVATGTSPLAYEWRLNGATVSTGNSKPILALDDVIASHGGEYTVTVSNAAGVVTSQIATLTVNPLSLLSGPVTNSNNGHIYYLLNWSSWAGAEAAAQTYGGHLVTINNQTENDWVFNTFRNWGNQGRHLWMGLYDPDPSINSSDPNVRATEFVWSNGESVAFSNWNTGQPDTWRGEEFHTMLWNHWGGLWNDMDGTNLLNGVLELDPAAPPTISNTPDVATPEDTPTAAIPFMVWDAVTQPASLQVSATSANQALVPDQNIALTGTGTNRTITLTPLTNQFGSSLITVSVNDGSSTVNDTFTLTVTAVNDPPTLAAITDRSTPEDTATGVPFVIGDIETAVIDLTVEALSSNPALVPNEGLAASGTGANRNLLVVPAANQSGTTTITVTVRDRGPDGIPNNGDDAAASDSFVLTVTPVTDPPVVLTPPAHQTVDLGSSATFNAVAGGDPTLSYQWRFNGTNLPGATAASLAIPSVTMAHAGNYDLLITNTAGAVTSSAAVLSIAEVIYANTTFPRHTHYGHGSSVEFGDQVWLRGSARILRELVVGLYAGVLTGDESVRVRLRANDGANGLPATILWQSAALPITVTGDSELVLGTSHFGGSLVLPESFTFTVEFAGFAPGDAVGLQIRVVPTVGVSAPQYWLLVGNVWESPYLGAGVKGNFHCRVTAVKQSQEPPVAPVILVGPQSANTDEGGHAAFTVLTSGTPPLTYQWRRDGANVANANAPVLDMADVQLGQAGNYSVVITNISGSITSVVAGLTVTALGTLAGPITNPANSHVYYLLEPSSWQTAESIAVSLGGHLVTLNDQAEQDWVASTFGAGPRDLWIGLYDPDQANNAPDAPTRLNEFVWVSGQSAAYANWSPGEPNNYTGIEYFTQIWWSSANEGKWNDAVGTALMSGVVEVPPDAPPAISDIPNQTINEDTATAALSFTIGDSVTAAGSLGVTGTSSDTVLVPNSRIVFGGSESNRTVTVTPAPNQFGAANITVTVNDGSGSASDTFIVTVNSVNDLPQIANIADQTTLEDTPFANVPFTLGDVETASTDLVLIASSSNPSLIPVANVVFGGSGSNRTVTVTPAPTRKGSATITVSVRDRGLEDITSTRNDIELGKEFYTAIQATNTITLDGQLTEWSEAPVLSNPKLAVPKYSGTNASPNYVLFEEYAGGTWTGPDDQSSAIQIVYDASNVYLGFIVTDDYHENAANSAWNGDAVQLMIASADRKTQVALYNYALGGIEGNIGDVIVEHEAGPGGTEAVVTRNATTKKTHYEIKLPAASLGLTAPLTAGMKFGLGMAINDGDSDAGQSGQRGWGGLGAHAIVFGKTPSETALISLTSSDEATAADSFVMTVTPRNRNDFNGDGLADVLFQHTDGTLAAWFMNGTTRLATAALSPSAPSATSTRLAGVGDFNSDGKPDLIFRAADSSLEAWLMNGTSRTSVAALNPANSGAEWVVAGIGDFNGDKKPDLLLQNRDGFLAVWIMDGINRSSSAFLNPNHPEAGWKAVGVGDLDRDGFVDVLFQGADTTMALWLMNGTSMTSTSLLNPAQLGAGFRLAALGDLQGDGGVDLILQNTSGDLRAWDLNGATQISSAPLDPVNPGAGWRVIGPNFFPAITPIADQTTNEDTPSAALAFTLGDDETAATALTVSGTSSNAALVPHASIVISGLGASRSVTVTPAPHASGTATITLTVSDGFLTASEDFVLTVNPVDDSPSITDIANQTIAEDSATAFIPFTIGDAESSAVSLSLTGVSTNKTLVPDVNITFGGSGSNRTVRVTPAANQSGATRIDVLVSDGAKTNLDAFVLTVTAVNDPPTITDVADRTVNEDTSTGPIQLTLSDLETPGAALTLSATSSNPTLVPNNSVNLGSIGANRSVTILPALNQFGSAQITFTVTDGSGAAASDSFLLTVNPVNDSPAVADIQNLAIDEDGSLGPLEMTVADVETPAANLVITASSSNPALVPNDHLVINRSGPIPALSLTPAAHQSGSVSILVQVRDAGLDGIPSNGDDAIASDTFDLVVRPVNDLPQVSITAPASGAIFTAPVDLNLKASASDIEAAVTRVEYYANGNYLGAAMVTPFALTWTNSPAGTHTLTARAVDSNDATNSSAPVFITVNPGQPANDPFAARALLAGSPLAINAYNSSASKELGEPNHAGQAGGRSVWWSWTAPFAGIATITTSGSAFDTLLGVYAGTTLNGLTIVAADDDSAGGGSSRVEFAAQAGAAYQIAVDGFGGISGSIALTISLNRPPVVTLDSPVSGAVMDAPAMIVLSASADDPDGSIARVEFFKNGELAASDSTAPFGASLAGVESGAYIFSARAVDDRGAGVNSATALVTVLPPRPPNDLFAARTPLSGSLALATGASTRATKEAGEPSHAGVQGGSSVWWSWTAPNAGVVTVTTAGSVFDTVLAVYTGAAVSALTAVVADDDGGGNGASRAVFDCSAGTSYHIAVDGFGGIAGGIALRLDYNSPPAVSLTNPPVGATFSAPATIELAAKASDVDGAVQQVEFYQGTTRIGAAPASPFAYIWQAVPAGSYTLSARAIDNGGLQTTSAPVTITVTGVAQPPVFTSHPLGGNFVAGAETVLSAAVSGTPPLFYQWRRNGLALPGATADRLGLPNLQLANAGTYTLQVTNLAGSATSSGAVVTIQTPPVIVLQPKSQSAAPGGSVTFNVTATGSTPLSYQWRFNGASIQNATTATLTLPNLQPIAAGRYAVVVANSAGTILSAEAVLDIGSPSTTPDPPSLARDDFWIADGPVRAILETNGVVYLGGNFGYVGPNSGSAALLSEASGEIDAQFPKFNGEVRAAIADGAGGFYVGGSFSIAGGLPRTNLARIRPDKTIDTAWAPNPNGSVRCLALAGGTLFVGGQFTLLNGQPRTNLGAIVALTGQVVSWQVNTDNPVNALAVAGTNIVVGGEFSTIEGRGRKRLAAISAADGTVTALKYEANAAVFALALQGQTLYLGGEFTAIEGSVRRYAAAVDLNGAGVLPWSPQPDAAVRALALSGGRVYLGGLFTSIQGQPRQFLARVDSSSGQLDLWQLDTDSTVWSLLAWSNRLYVAGQFTRVGGLTRDRLACVDLLTGLLRDWHPAASDRVLALAGDSGGILAAGRFKTIGGKPRRFLAALNALTGVATEWAPELDDEVHALAFAGSTLFAGGQFQSVGAAPRRFLAGIDAASGQATAFNGDLDDYPYALAASGDRLFVGGVFLAAANQPRTRLAAFHWPSGALAGWAPAVDDAVFALLVRASDNSVIAGGDFLNSGTTPRQRLAAFDGVTGALKIWNPGADARVAALAANEASLVAGGFFTTIGGASRPRLAQIDASGDATAWDPDLDDILTGQPAVNAAAIHGNALYVGGQFDTVRGAPRARLAGVDRISASALSWDPGADGPVYALAAAGNNLYAGGGFSAIGGGVRPNFVAFTVPGAPIITQHPRSQTVALGAASATLSVAAIGLQPLTYQWQKNGVNLPNQTGAALTLSAPQSADDGVYRVLVSNSKGTVVSAEAAFLILAKPVFTLDPLSTNVPPGTTVRFDALAAGSPPILYQWTRNGIELAGETNASLTLENLQPTASGSYRVRAANAAGTATSALAALDVAVGSAFAFSDHFAGRALIVGVPDGAAAGSNVGATREAREPNHAGKPGNRSIWIAWRAPATGIAKVATEGSSFDTLLAVYTGVSIDTLVPIASDEDQGGFFASAASFNAVAGTDYSIVIDGFGGASGRFLLQWTLEPTQGEDVPRITRSPKHVTVALGSKATLTSAGESLHPLSYQWFRNNHALAGATSSSLVLPAVRLEDVGVYFVRISNATRSVRSADVVVEIGPNYNAVTEDKMKDVIESSAALPAVGAASRRKANYASVSSGILGSQILHNFGATMEENEPNPAPGQASASRWFQLSIETSGTLIVDTIGSTIDTVLALYTGTDLLNLNPEGSDDNGAPDGVRSRVVIQAVRGSYMAQILGREGAMGDIRLNWILGTRPAITSLLPASITTTNGGAASFVAAASGTPTNLVYQWRHDGIEIPAATNSTLTLQPVSAPDAGDYSVIVANPIGSITSGSVSLIVQSINLDSRSATLAGGAAATGSTRVVPVEFISLGNENTIEFSFNFEPAVLMLAGVSAGAGAGGAAFVVDTSDAPGGRAGLSIQLPAGHTFAAGARQLALLTFNIAPSVGAPSYALAFADAPTPRRVVTTAGADLAAAWIDGQLTFTVGYEADTAPRPSVDNPAGGNDSISVADWVQVGRFAAGLDIPVAGLDFQKADCAPLSTFGDGQISVADWVQAGRFAAGLDSRTPTAGPAAPP